MILNCASKCLLVGQKQVNECMHRVHLIAIEYELPLLSALTFRKNHHSFCTPLITFGCTRVHVSLLTIIVSEF